MWFKQVHILKLSKPITYAPDKIAVQLEAFGFKPCLPSMVSSSGWVAPLDYDEEDSSLVLSANQCMLLALQIEEKILPTNVVNYALKEQVKKIERNESRRLRSKEKLNLKDEIIFTLLQRAFSKFSLVYAYIDTINGWLVINSVSATRIEQFLTIFKKTFGNIVENFELHKPSTLLTQWLKEKKYPREFAIEKACVLQDPKQQNRIIRVQQQDLFASSVQAFLKDGCEVIQITLTWQDRLQFIMNDHFVLRSIHLADDDLLAVEDSIESKRQRLTTDLVMMTKMYAELFKDLMNVFVIKKQLAQTA